MNTEPNLRVYGEPPHNLAVVHGGPGARGEMAPVARRIAAMHGGVLEPLQAATSVAGQIEELYDALRKHDHAPYTLIGFSWGAWLCYMVAARYPDAVQKLILISSGPFELKYVEPMRQTRANRLSADESTAFATLASALADPTTPDKDGTLARLGKLVMMADAFDLIDPDELDELDGDALMPRADIFQSVWPEAAALRKSGELLEMGRAIRCPVVAIHGDYDPHPADGVREPLAATLADFKFILLEDCSHKPWIERQAKDAFYTTLLQEVEK